MALGKSFLNNKVVYRSVVSQNEIPLVFKILDILRTASPFLRMQINNEGFDLWTFFSIVKLREPYYSVLICTLDNGLAVRNIPSILFHKHC